MTQISDIWPFVRVVSATSNVLMLELKNTCDTLKIPGDKDSKMSKDTFDSDPRRKI